MNFGDNNTIFVTGNKSDYWSREHVKINSKYIDIGTVLTWEQRRREWHKKTKVCRLIGEKENGEGRLPNVILFITTILIPTKISRSTTILPKIDIHFMKFKFAGVQVKFYRTSFVKNGLRIEKPKIPIKNAAALSACPKAAASTMWVGRSRHILTLYQIPTHIGISLEEFWNYSVHEASGRARIVPVQIQLGCQ